MSSEQLVTAPRDVAGRFEIEGVRFKPPAIERAAHAVAGLERPVAHLYRDGGADALRKRARAGLELEEYGPFCEGRVAGAAIQSTDARANAAAAQPSAVPSLPVASAQQRNPVE